MALYKLKDIFLKSNDERKKIFIKKIEEKLQEFTQLSLF